MPKAILELEMPESCGQCPCSHFHTTLEFVMLYCTFALKKADGQTAR
jgi:hypothetical protein